MKRLLALLLATLMVLSLTACKKGNADGDDKKDYSKLSTADKITYILGKISDEPDTEGHYVNEMIGIRVNLDDFNGTSYELDYPTKSMKETDYTKEYLSTIESQENITVFSAEGTIASMTINIVKMSQAEIDDFDAEASLENIKNENATATIDCGTVANIPVYYIRDEYTTNDIDFYGNITECIKNRCFFAIKCNGYLAEFNFISDEYASFDSLINTIFPIANTSYTKSKDSKLQQLYNAYQKNCCIGEIIDNNKHIIFSETDDKDNEIRRVYGTAQNLSEEIMVMYKPDNNTISVITSNTGFYNYDDYSFEDGTIVEFDENNIPVRLTDTEGDITTYTYDDEGYLIKKNDSSYQYSADRKTIIFNDGQCEYKYNDKGLLIEKKGYIWDSPSGWTSSNFVAQWEYATGYIYEYDNQDRIIKQKGINEDGTRTGYCIVYEYDSFGRMKKDSEWEYD